MLTCVCVRVLVVRALQLHYNVVPVSLSHTHTHTHELLRFFAALLSDLFDLEQLNIESQGSVGRNDTGMSTASVGIVG